MEASGLELRLKHKLRKSADADGDEQQYQPAQLLRHQHKRAKHEEQQHSASKVCGSGLVVQAGVPKLHAHGHWPPPLAGSCWRMPNMLGRATAGHAVMGRGTGVMRGGEGAPGMRGQAAQGFDLTNLSCRMCWGKGGRWWLAAPAGHIMIGGNQR